MNPVEYTLKFKGTINPSIQKGDIVWCSGNINQIGATQDFSHSVTDNDDGESTMEKMGTVVSISDLGNTYEIIVEVLSTQTLNPSSNSFYFFSKNNEVNKSSIKGYYNSVTFSNDSTTRAELFATSFAVSPSSK